MHGIATEIVFFNIIPFFSFRSISEMVKIPRRNTLNGEVNPIQSIIIKILVKLKVRKLKNILILKKKNQ